MIFWIVQGLGIVSLILYAISLQMKNKENLLILQFFGNISFAIQYILTNAITGLAQAIISIIRGVVFYIFKKRNLNPNIITIIVFGIAIAASTILTWQNTLSILPFCGTSASLYGQWQDNMTKLKILTIVSSLFWLIYEFYAGMYTAMLTEICIIASSLIALWRFRSIKCEQKRILRISLKKPGTETPL